MESRFFDRLLETESDFNPFTEEAWGLLARRFRESLEGEVVGSMLDVGCGTGSSRAVYNGATRHYTGVDLSFGALTRARGRDAATGWRQADACRLPFRSESLDLVAFSSVLHHIPGYGAALSEAFRVLRPGGRVFAFDPNLLHPAMALFRWPRSPLYIAEGVSPNEAPLLPANLRRRFIEARFVAVQQRCQSGLSYRSVAPSAIRACLSVYNVADRLFEASGLGRWLGTFVLTWARKPART